jgi:hypothetical protein
MPELKLNPKIPEMHGIEVFLTMCFPDDEGKRKEYQALFASKIPPEMVKSRQNEEVINLLVKGYDFLNQASSWDAMLEDVSSKTCEGCMAGDVLHYALCMVNDKNEGGINKACRIVERKHHTSAIKQRKWPKYKSVAHLWCAYRDWMGDSAESIQKGAENSFLLSENLPTFLAAAEQIRIYAENSVTGKQPKLDPRETWKVPSDYALPKIEIQLPTYNWDAMHK